MTSKKTGYKLFDLKDNNLFFLYHGINKSLKVPIGVWIDSEKKLVSDGGKKYISGFHYFKTIEDATKYLRRFTTRKLQKTIVKVEVKNFWKKDNSLSGVFLAEKIKVL
jgi:hypothetical protein